MAGENKIRIHRSTTTGNVPPTTSAVDEGEISVNLADRKVYTKDAAGAALLVADRITDYSDQLKYIVGDFTIEASTFYRCINAITTPEAFNVANWEVLGVGSDASSVILAPLLAGRNTITTVGQPTVEGLRITGDNAQTAPMQVWEGTGALDGGSASIDNLGFPSQRFGAAAWRATKGSHNWEAIGVGSPIAFTTVWELGQTGVNVTYGVLQEIVDVNTVMIRQSGVIENLDPAAFAGGVITVGLLYYPSDTVAGQLTSVAPLATSAVLLVTGPTTGLVTAGNASSVNPSYHDSNTAGTSFPIDPLPGDLHYLTAPLTNLPIGAYIWSGLAWAMSDVDRWPAGMYADFAMEAIPYPFVWCDGALLDRTEHAQLFAAIGEDYGAGDGSTTFAIPDLRGDFTRGATAPGGTGTRQADEIKAHAHLADPPNTVTDVQGDHTHNGTLWTSAAGSGGFNDVDVQTTGGATSRREANTQVGGAHAHNLNIPAFWTQNTGGSETRPRNMSVVKCIASPRTP